MPTSPTSLAAAAPPRRRWLRASICSSLAARAAEADKKAAEAADKLFPGVAFRISDEKDEDAPYPYDSMRADGSSSASSSSTSASSASASSPFSAESSNKTIKPALSGAALGATAEAVRAADAAAAASLAFTSHDDGGEADADGVLDETVALAAAPEEADAAFDAALRGGATVSSEDGSRRSDEDGSESDGSATKATEALIVALHRSREAQRREKERKKREESRGLLLGHADEDLAGSAAARPQRALPERSSASLGSVDVDSGATAPDGSGSSSSPSSSTSREKEGAFNAAKSWVSGAASGVASGVGGWASGVGGAVAGWWGDRTRGPGGGGSARSADSRDEPNPREARAEANRKRALKDRAEGRGPVDDEDIVVPADLPLEAIAEEVKNSWRLKEVHAEKLVRRAVERSEKPWLILLTAFSASSALLLLAVLWKMHTGDFGGP